MKDLNWGFEMVNGVRHSRINNFIIFSNAYAEFIDQGSLYVGHPTLHYDYYKYTLTFALFMAPFAVLPLGIGLISWNLLNLWVFILGVKCIPGLKKKAALFVVLFSALELLGSIQNEQSNGLMTGLIILFVALMERNKPTLAIALLAFSVYIKLFSIVFFIFLFFYPKTLKNALLAAFWMVFYLFIPLIVSGKEYFLAQYNAWFRLILEDHEMSYGYSVMGLLNSWFRWTPDKIYLVLVSLLLSVLPMLKTKMYSNQMFRYSTMAVLLIWVVIFNHKSESPLFILAMSGIAIWYVSNKTSTLKKVLAIFAICFVSLAFSELMPKRIMEDYFYAYSLKALPALIIWGKIIFDLLKSTTTHDIEPMAQKPSGHKF